MADQNDYQEDEGAASTTDQKSVTDADALFGKLKRWFKGDYNSHGQTHWRREAHEDFGFDAGDQLTEDDKNILKEAGRPIVIFNRIGVSVDSVAGQEVANRQEVQYLPRKQGDVIVNEMLTAAAKWFRQQCDAEDEESDAFRDTVVCGMGWTETKIDYEDNPKGDPKIDRVDPLEMVWDAGAKKRNLVDKRRVFHIRRDVPIEEARALCPGDPSQPFEDDDYNATWVDDAKDPAKPHENDGHFYNKENLNGAQDQDAEECTVTMVRAQWWEREPVWLTMDPSDPSGQKLLTLNKDQFKQLGEQAKAQGIPLPKMVKSTRKVYRQAYLGNVLLEIGDCPCPKDFSFNCITGKRDRNKNTFFGIVRAMKDPSRWSNKWMMQTMHIMNTSAKGGIAVERGAFFDDDQAGEESWAQNDQVTVLKPGALAGGNPKMIAKPVSAFPQGTFELMNFAVSSLPQVSGVNVETLGMQAQVDQAASLDRQRKQAVMIILQPLFDGLRRYRKEQGRVMLYLIEHFLSDGRLIKIEGQDKAQYVPLIKQEADGDDNYDVIVDESPTSANQKDATWAILQQLLPVIGKMLPPATWLALLKYSPLPTSAQDDISESIKQSQAQPSPEQQKADAELKLQQEKQQADIAHTSATSAAKIQALQQESAAKIQADKEHAHNQLMLKALTTPAQVDPATGQPVQGSGGGETAALVMGLMNQMREEQRGLAQTIGDLAKALNTPKQVIRDQSGNIVGMAPMAAQPPMGAQQ